MLYSYVEYLGYRYFPAIRVLKYVGGDKEIVRVGQENLTITFSFDDQDNYSILLYLGNNCNFNCSYCFRDGVIEYLINISALGKLFSILKIKKLFLLGGEVLFYYDKVIEIVEKLVPLGLRKVIIYTNGYSVNRDLVLDILKFGCDIDFIVTMHLENFNDLNDAFYWYNQVLMNLSELSLYSNYAYMLTGEGNSLNWLKDFVVEFGNKVTSFMLYPVLSLGNFTYNDDKSKVVQGKLAELLLTAIDINRWYALWDRDVVFQTLYKRRCLYDRLYLDERGYVYGCVGACSNKLVWSQNEMIAHVNDISIERIKDFRNQRLFSFFKEECQSCIGNVVCYFESCPYIDCNSLVKAVSEFYGIGVAMRIIQKWVVGGKLDAGEVQCLL